MIVYLLFLLIMFDDYLYFFLKYESLFLILEYYFNILG